MRAHENAAWGLRANDRQRGSYYLNKSLHGLPLEYESVGKLSCGTLCSQVSRTVIME
jgi:hypothetical protein